MYYTDYQHTPYFKYTHDHTNPLFVKLSRVVNIPLFPTAVRFTSVDPFQRSFVRLVMYSKWIHVAYCVDMYTCAS